MIWQPYLTLDETTPIWQALDPIPDRGSWAHMGSRSPEQTLRLMQRNVQHAIRMRQVVELACAIVSQAPDRDFYSQASLIRQYVTRHFKFVRDAHRVECVRRPEYLLQRIRMAGVVCGDCDDAAQLVATLGKAVGFPAWFMAIAFDPMGQWPTHVYTVLGLPNGREIHFDVTKPREFALGLLPEPTVTGYAPWEV